MKCKYCQEDGKCHEDCPDKLPAGPERDCAMADWGAGTMVASMGEPTTDRDGLHPCFTLGYDIFIKMGEDVQRVLLDDDQGDDGSY